MLTLSWQLGVPLAVGFLLICATRLPSVAKHLRLKAVAEDFIERRLFWISRNVRTWLLQRWEIVFVLVFASVGYPVMKASVSLLADPISVTPARVQLGTGDFIQKTQLRIVNNSEEALFAIAVDVIVDPPNVSPYTIELEMDPTPARVPRLELGNTIVYPEPLVIRGFKEGHAWVQTRLYSLEPKEVRYATISSSAPVPSVGTVSVASYSKSPPTLQQELPPRR